MQPQETYSLKVRGAGEEQERALRKDIYQHEVVYVEITDVPGYIVFMSIAPTEPDDHTTLPYKVRDMRLYQAWQTIPLENRLGRTVLEAIKEALTYCEPRIELSRKISIMLGKLSPSNNHFRFRTLLRLCWQIVTSQ